MNKVFKGNNLEIMRTFEKDLVDCTITSPPYNKKENKNTGGIFKAVKYDTYIDTLIEEDYQKQQIEVIDEIFRITKPGGHLFYNHKVRFEDGLAIFPLEWLLKTKWRIRQEIIWDRKSAINVRAWRFHVKDERIYWLYKPIDENDKGVEIFQRYASEGSIWRFSPELTKTVKELQKHPAPFPLELPKRVLSALYENGTNKVIFDPYVGSGTTVVAAKEFGHQYIGIDISKNYLKITKERLKNAKEETFGLNGLFE